MSICPQSMQSLWFLQQERNRFSGSLIQAIRKQIRMGLLFLYGKQETISSLHWINCCYTIQKNRQTLKACRFSLVS